jgi:uncharacterized protein YkwD
MHGRTAPVWRPLAASTTLSRLAPALLVALSLMPFSAARAFAQEGDDPVAAEAPPAEVPPSTEAAASEAPSEAASLKVEPAAVEAPAAAEAPPAKVSMPDQSSQPDLGAVIAQPDLDARTRLEMEILGRINGIRAEHGLPALKLDDRLVAAAREHAVDMAARNFCRHNGSDGTQVRDRLRRNGYPYNNWAGENILCGRKSADAALGWWMNSAPHRRNILHGHFTHIGVGVSMHGSWGPDMTLTFAAGDANTAEPGVFRSFREGKVGEWISKTREPESYR